MPVKIITRYDYEERAKIAPGVHFDAKKDKSLTNQGDLESTDINKIMARFEQTGFIPGTERKPMYGDFSEVADYHTQLSALRRVEAAFGALPASLRNRFENDPAKLVSWLSNPANDGEAVKLGLKPAPAAAPPSAPAPPDLTGLDEDEKASATKRYNEKKAAWNAAHPEAPIS